MKKIYKLGATLFLITAVAGLLLGWVHAVTEEPIARLLEKEKIEAMKATLPVAQEFKLLNADLTSSGIIREVNEGYNAGKIVGYNIKVAPKGYGGVIEMMVGISIDGTLRGIQILSHSETPGLGAEAGKPAFSNQFSDRHVDALSVVKGETSNENEIQAMTGATITSRAVTDGVNQALRFFHSSLKGEGA